MSVCVTGLVLKLRVFGLGCRVPVENSVPYLAPTGTYGPFYNHVDVYYCPLVINKNVSFIKKKPKKHA
jgi:hypothetical protein